MILLGIGHNEKERGACNGSFCEFDIASNWIPRIKEILEYEEIPVKVIPDGSLTDKVAFVNSHEDAVAAVELHFNSNIRGARGSESLYAPGSVGGKELAERIQDQFERRSVFQPNRGAKVGYYQADPSKGLLYFLRATKCVAVIIEPEFMSILDAILDIDNFYHGCDAIAQAIKEYYEVNV